MLVIFLLVNRTTIAPRISANGFSIKKYDEKKSQPQKRLTCDINSR